MGNVRTVHRDEGADAVLVGAVLEQVPHAAQIAWPLLADIGDDQQVGAGAHSGGIHRAKPGEQHRQRPRVVADARGIQLRAVPPHGHVGAGGEHGVQVGSNTDQWGIAHSRAHSGDISFGVDFQVLEAMYLGHRKESAGAGFLLERRSSDLGQRDDVLNRPVVLGGEGSDGRAIGLARHDLVDNRHGPSGHGIGSLRQAPVLAEAGAARKRGNPHGSWSADCNGICRRCRNGWGSPSP